MYKVFNLYFRWEYLAPVENEQRELSVILWMEMDGVAFPSSHTDDALKTISWWIYSMLEFRKFQFKRFEIKLLEKIRRLFCGKDRYLQFLKYLDQSDRAFLHRIDEDLLKVVFRKDYLPDSEVVHQGVCRRTQIERELLRAGHEILACYRAAGHAEHPNVKDVEKAVATLEAKAGAQ